MRSHDNRPKPMNDFTIPAPVASNSQPGRSCPIDYHYGPDALAAAAALRCDAAWVVGGLYGNSFALDVIEQAFAAERESAALVFNGDFHWFDAQAQWFDEIQRRVGAYHATRGNVETECARGAFDASIGCGCAYPDYVGELVVQRSNRILAKLWDTCASTGHAAALASLPMYRRLQIGAANIAVVHGDLESLAGWRFDADALRHAPSRRLAEQLTASVPFDLIASSHTCAPVLDHFGATLLINNGAAGMGNFQNDSAGIVTRIAIWPLRALGDARLRTLRLRVMHSQQHAGVWVEAVAVDFDLAAFQRRFASVWPAGSDAYESYAARIAHGGNMLPQQAYGIASSFDPSARS